MKKLVLLVILIVLLTIFLSADIYMKSMERTQAFEIMGNKQPEKVEIKETWLAENKFANYGKEHTLILNMDKGTIYFILHKEKIYIELPTDITKEKLLNYLANINPKAAEIAKSIKITDAKVNISKETKKIANWDCTATEFEMVFMIPGLGMMPKFKMKLWATEDIPFDYEKCTKVWDEFFVKHILGIINIDEDSLKEMEKMETVKGFQVANEVTVSIFGTEINVESQSMEIAEKPAPPGTYSVPRGYKRKAINIQ